MTELSAINRTRWSERTAIHTRDAAEYYMVDRFLAGADTLVPIESVEIGSIAGWRVRLATCCRRSFNQGCD
jgi:hypothetical protein